MAGKTKARPEKKVSPKYVVASPRITLLNGAQAKMGDVIPTQDGEAILASDKDAGRAPRVRAV